MEVGCLQRFGLRDMHSTVFCRSVCAVLDALRETVDPLGGGSLHETSEALVSGLWWSHLTVTLSTLGLIVARYGIEERHAKLHLNTLVI